MADCPLLLPLSTVQDLVAILYDLHLHVGDYLINFCLPHQKEVSSWQEPKVLADYSVLNTYQRQEDSSKCVPSLETALTIRVSLFTLNLYYSPYIFNSLAGFCPSGPSRLHKIELQMCENIVSSSTLLSSNLNILSFFSCSI